MKIINRIPVKTTIVFVLTFLIIASIHIWHNTQIITKKPSEGWSKNLKVGEATFNRSILAEISDQNYTVLLYPYEDGKGKLGLIKVDKSLDVIDTYSLKLNGFNANHIYPNEIKFVDGQLFWRSYKDNKVYMALFDKTYNQITSVKPIFEEVRDYSITTSPENIYLALTKLDGKLAIYKQEEDGFNQIEGVETSEQVLKSNLKYFDNKLYLQAVVGEEDNYKRNIMVSTYNMTNWSSWVQTSLINELGEISILDLALGVDQNYVYSIIITSGEGPGRYIYNLGGYKKTTKEVFKTIEYAAYKRYSGNKFTSLPSIIDKKEGNLEIYTTAYSSIDIYNKGSNAIKMMVKGNEIEDVTLLSNTKSWSSHLTLVDLDQYKHVIWLEPGGFGTINIKAATSNKLAFNKLDKTTFDDIKDAIYNELPVFSYLFLLLIAKQLLIILPALIWFGIIFIASYKFEGKLFLTLVPGIAVSFIGELIAVFGFYQPRYMRFFPELLRPEGLKFIMPILFTLLGCLVVWIYKREKEGDDVKGYNLYMVFLAYTYIFSNYLYAPYIFIK